MAALVIGPFALVSVYIPLTALVLYVLIIGIAMIVARFDQRRLERQLARRYYDCILRVDDEGVELETKVSRSRFHWEDFQKAWHGNGVLLLQTTMGQVMLLPTVTPDPDLSEQLAEWIESSLPVTPEEIKLPPDPGPSDFTPDDVSDTPQGDDLAAASPVPKTKPPALPKTRRRRTVLLIVVLALVSIAILLQRIPRAKDGQADVAVVQDIVIESLRKSDTTAILENATDDFKRQMSQQELEDSFERCKRTLGECEQFEETVYS